MSEEDSSLHEQIKLLSAARFTFDISTPFSAEMRDSFVARFSALVCSAGDFKDEVERVLSEAHSTLGKLTAQFQLGQTPDIQEAIYRKLERVCPSLIEGLLAKGKESNFGMSEIIKVDCLSMFPDAIPL